MKICHSFAVSQEKFVSLQNIEKKKRKAGKERKTVLLPSFSHLLQTSSKKNFGSSVWSQANIKQKKFPVSTLLISRKKNLVLQFILKQTKILCKYSSNLVSFSLVYIYIYIFLFFFIERTFHIEDFFSFSSFCFW
jgi:hypothetical protein